MAFFVAGFSMLPNNCNALKDRVTEFNELYSFAEKAYKTSQVVTKKIDSKIHNEYHYCARGLAEWTFLVNKSSCENDIINEIQKDNKTFSEIRLLAKIQRAEHAVRNIFNDSIDLVIADARKKLDEMSLIETQYTLPFYIDDLDELISAIDCISIKISESRSNLTDRVEIYKNILNSKEFEKLTKFCLKSDLYLNKIIVDHRNLSDRLTKERKRFYWQIFFSILSLIIATITLITKLPSFFTWLFTTFPDLHLLGLERYF